MPVHKKGTKNPYKIIILCLYFQFAVKFLKDSCITRYLISFLKKSLISANQSGFKPGNSCVNHFFPNALFIYPLKTLENCKVFWCFPGIEKGCIGKKWINEFLSIKHNIYKSFDENYKSINRHFKSIQWSQARWSYLQIKKNGISGNLFKILKQLLT